MKGPWRVRVEGSCRVLLGSRIQRRQEQKDADLTHSLYSHSSPDLSKPFSGFGKRVNKSLPRSVTYPSHGQMVFHRISRTLPKDVWHAIVGNVLG